MWDATQSLKKRIWSTFLLLMSAGVLFLYHWTGAAINTAHVMPVVEWQDIRVVVNGMRQLSQEEIALLTEQTGLGENTILDLQGQGRAEELLAIQRIYFAPVEIESIQTTPLTVSEWLAKDPLPGYKCMPMVDIQNGDILITKNSRFLGWRNGHAGLVVDAENGLVLEAIMLGSPSQLCKVSKWESYPSFLVLRLKEEFANSSIPSSVASYAEEYLVGVPYQLLAGIFKGEAYKGQRAEALGGTQCAHLVWYVYKQFGIDLDSDGGLLVTPYDIQNSPYLEVVQSYGY